MSYLDNDGATVENTTDLGAGNGDGQEENHLEGGLTEEDETFIEGLEAKDIDDMTADERENLKEILGKAKTTIGQRKHWKTKHDELAQQLNKKETPAPKPKNEAGKSPAGAPQSADDKIRYQKIEFRQDHSELTKDQVDEIFAYSASKRITPEEAMKSSLIKKFLETSKSDREAEEASGHPSSGGAARPKAQAPSFKDMSSKDFAAKRAQIMRDRRR